MKKYTLKTKGVILLLVVIFAIGFGLGTLLL